jgi:hypothetical protein
MIILKKAIPRRTFLRGAGVTLALPLLDSMLPALASSSGPEAQRPLRVQFFYVPNGRIMEKWTPATLGKGYEITPSLKPLENFRDQMTVLGGLNILSADTRPGEGGSGHARSSASYLTGIHPAPNGELGPSIDQVFAREYSKNTQFGSLEIGMESPEIDGKADGDYSEYYTKTISWRTGVQPLPIENNPRRLFDRLFGGSTSTDRNVRLGKIKEKRSILDFVKDETERLTRQVGKTDQTKVSEYLDSVRDIERRIQLAETQIDRDMPTVERPLGIPSTYSEQAKVLLDLQVLALQTDLTRVITFMFGLESGEGDYRELGITEGHHALSHHNHLASAVEGCEKIDVFHSELFAYYLEKLQGITDGDGSLLDHSLIINGSGLNDGNLHTHNDIPVLIVGGGNRMKLGQHVRIEGEPLTNLWLTMLDIANVPNLGFGEQGDTDATGTLDKLRA